MVFHKNPYVIVTKWAYPYGGGEQYMRQTMHIMCKYIDSVWLCFNNARNEIFPTTKVVDLSQKNGDNKTYHCKMICVAGGFTERKLYCWLRMLNPTMVQCQGALKTETERAVSALNIPMMSGFHFWHGLVLLDKVHGNVRIRENIAGHSIDPMFRDHTLRRSDIIYGPSVFFNEMVKLITNEDLFLLPPMPDPKEVLIDFNLKPEDFSKKYVTIVNIHESKGGRLFYFLLQNLPAHIPLLGVRTDVFQTELDRKIDVEISKRPNSTVIPRCDDVRQIYCRTKLLLQPSECDETFCRVLVEAHANGIATLSSDYGNLPYLHVGDEAKRRCVVSGSATDSDYYAKWCKAIETEFEKVEGSDSLAKICKTNYDTLQSMYNSETMFLECFNKGLTKAKIRNGNVALFAPWCDQGLGIQTRNYAIILRDAGYKVFIFSFLPYTGKREQANPQEWIIPGITVYYSKNNREQVDKREILAFALRTRIKKAIIAETCWHRVFSMMSELKSAGVQVFAVPNVEIVRCDEIEKHLVFDTILLNNRICENLFVRHGFPKQKLCYVNYSITNTTPDTHHVGKVPQTTDIVSILILGGRNAISRKHVDLAIRALLNVSKQSPTQKRGLQLVATSQIECRELTVLQNEIAQSNGQVVLKLGNLTAADVNNLYEKSHIVMQISKHEGLGIGFFEALTKKKPIITLNVEPHRECAPKDVAWYIEPDAMVENTENNSCGIQSAKISVETLQAFFTKLSAEIQEENWWKTQYEPKMNAIPHISKERDAFFTTSFLQAINGNGVNRFS